jgi:hypothetical protein
VLGAVILGALVAGAVAVSGRANELNDAIYDQCVRDEVQDASSTTVAEIVRAQLEAAKRRLPKPTTADATAEVVYQRAVLNAGIEALTDQIVALEPPDEEECTPPEGVQTR